MLTRKIFTCLFSATVLFGSGLYLTAQDRDSTGSPPNATQWLNERFKRSFIEPDWLVATEREQNNLFGNETATESERNNLFANETATAVQAFKAAESEEAKSTAKAELRKALVADYENKMDQYDAHLEKLEKELEAMRERLSRRRAAKEDMVDLKLKETIANADGLGWPSGPNSMNVPGRLPPSYSSQYVPGIFSSPKRTPTRPAQRPTVQRTQKTN